MAQELGGLLLIGDVDAGEGEGRVDEDDVGLMGDDKVAEGLREGRARADGVAVDGEVVAQLGAFGGVDVGAGDDVLEGFADVARVVLSLEHDGAEGLGGLDAEEVATEAPVDGGLHHQGGLARAGLADDQEGAALAEPAMVAEDGGRVFLALEGEQGVEVHALRAVADLLALEGEGGVVLEEGVWVGGVRGRGGGGTEEGRVGDELDVLGAVVGRAGVADQERDGGGLDG